MTNILYTDRHMGKWTDTQTDRQAESSIPPKTFVLQVYKYEFVIVLAHEANKT